MSSGTGCSNTSLDISAVLAVTVLSSATSQCDECAQAACIGFVCCRSHGLKEEHARFFFQQIILAIDYCHKMKVSNRWVAPQRVRL